MWEQSCQPADCSTQQLVPAQHRPSALVYIEAGLPPLKSRGVTMRICTWFSKLLRHLEMWPHTDRGWDMFRPGLSLSQTAARVSRVQMLPAWLALRGTVLLCIGWGLASMLRRPQRHSGYASPEGQQGLTGGSHEEEQGVVASAGLPTPCTGQGFGWCPSPTLPSTCQTHCASQTVWEREATDLA